MNLGIIAYEVASGFPNPYRNANTGNKNRTVGIAFTAATKYGSTPTALRSWMFDPVYSTEAAIEPMTPRRMGVNQDAFDFDCVSSITLKRSAASAVRAWLE
jgi:hypothetical protein